MSLVETEQLLRNLISGIEMDKANKELKRFLQVDENLMKIITCVRQSEDPAIRQMAASVARKKFRTNWEKYPETTQKEMKAFMLEAVLCEQNKLVRQSIAQIISTMARTSLISNQWPEFMPWLDTCIVKGNDSQREIGIVVLGNIIGGMASQLRPMFAYLFPLFEKCLDKSQSIEVRYQTMIAMTPLLVEMEPQELPLLLPSIPQVIFTVRELLGNLEYEHMAIEAFDFFDALFANEVLIKLMDAAIAEMIKLFLEVAIATQFSNTIRTSALTHIYWISTNSKKFILKNNLVEPILDNIFRIMAEPIQEDEEEDEMDSEGTPREFAQHVLDCFAINLSPRIVVKPSLKLLEVFSRSQNPNERKAAQLTLRTIAEGCAEYLKPQLNSIVPYIINSLDDPQVEVKEAACLAIIEFSRHLQPDICDYAETILPRVFSLMDAPKIELQEKACVALECFCVHLGEKLVPHLSVIMNKFCHMLDHSPPKLKECVVFSIGSTAVAACEGFVPYLPQVYPGLLAYMKLTSPEDASLRAKATDAMAAIISSIGRDSVTKIITDVVPLGLSNLQLQQSEIDLCTFDLFGSIAKVFGEEFGPQIPNVISHIIRVLNLTGLDDDSTDDLNGLANGGAGAADADDGDDDWDCEDFENNMWRRIDQDVAHAKEAALGALESFAEYCPKAFHSYISTDLLQIVAEHAVASSSLDQHPDIQRAAISALCQCMECVWTVNNLDVVKGSWTAGLPAKPVQPAVDQMITRVMDIIVETITSSDNKDLVGAAINAIADPLRNIGPILLEKRLEDWLGFMFHALKGELPCQSIDLDDDELSKLTVGEQDSVLIDSACELICETALCLGPNFNQYFPTFAPLLFRFYSDDRSDEERACCVGTFSDIVKAMKEHIQPYANEICQLFFRGTRDEADDVRVSSVFGIGLLCEFGGPKMHQQFPVILNHVAPLFTDEHNHVKDNAVACIARMVLANHDNLPMDQIVTAIVNALPLKKDYEENVVVYQCLLWLCKSSDEVFKTYGPQLVSTLIHINIKKEVELQKEEALTYVTEICALLKEKQPQLYAQVEQAVLQNQQQ